MTIIDKKDVLFEIKDYIHKFSYDEVNDLLNNTIEIDKQGVKQMGWVYTNFRLKSQKNIVIYSNGHIEIWDVFNHKLIKFL